MQRGSPACRSCSRANASRPSRARNLVCSSATPGTLAAHAANNSWLDLAWQLGGEVGIAALGDAAYTSPPGTAALTRLFAAANGPVLILTDEVQNFINRHRSLADPFYAFLDNVVRAATGTRHVAVVLSLPKSSVEMTQYEQGWQARITKIVKRVARDLIANEESEVSEGVRAACSRTLAPRATAPR